MSVYWHVIYIPLLTYTHTHTHTHIQQVEEWYPELIEVEERAKDAASLLFFVIDSQTRAVSSMVEIAFFAGKS